MKNCTTCKHTEFKESSVSKYDYATCKKTGLILFKVQLNCKRYTCDTKDTVNVK